MLKIHIPFFYDCFKPSDDSIYQLPTANTSSTLAPFSSSISSYISSILPKSGSNKTRVSALIVILSLRVEFNLIFEKSIFLTMITLSPEQS